MKPPSWVTIFQNQRHWYKAAGEILEAVKFARDGGPFSTALAGLSIFGKILDTLFPGENSWQVLEQRGYRDTNFSIGGFLCELFLQSDMPMTILPVGLTTQIFVWETKEGGVAAVYNGGEYGDGPYLRDGDEKFFIKALQDVVWTNGNDLMLSANRGYFWRGAKKFRLTPMPTPGSYIGRKRPEDFAERLAKYGDTPRTTLLRGPTGIGKSVLARHIAKASDRGSARTLKIAASVLRACRFDEVIALTRYFQPSVLLLDDLELGEKQNIEEFLTLLEALRAPNCLVIVTMMAATDRDKAPQMGDWHFEGMRPGRIDEIFTFYLPDAEDRDLILQHYYKDYGIKISRRMQKQIIKATENLSGAYLMEVARRLQVHGIKSWKEEIENVKRTAPNPKASKEKGKDDGKCDAKPSSD